MKDISEFTWQTTIGAVQFRELTVNRVDPKTIPKHGRGRPRKVSFSILYFCWLTQLTQSPLKPTQVNTTGRPVLAPQDGIPVRRGCKALPLSEDGSDDEQALETACEAFGSFCPEGESDVDKQLSDDLDEPSDGEDCESDEEADPQQLTEDQLTAVDAALRRVSLERSQ